jgi:heptosyltransferase-2
MKDRIEHLVLSPPNWLGDVVMAQPAMRALVTAMQPARVTLFGRPWLAELLPFLDIPGASYCDAIPAHADAAILFPNSFRSAWLAYRAGIKRRIGFRGQWRRLLLTDAPRPRVSLRHGHHRDFYLDLAEQLGVDVRQREVRLAMPPQEVEAGERMLREQGLEPQRTVAVAPGAQFGGAKRYPAEAYAHVLRGLSEEGWQLLILGTEAEREIGAQCLSGVAGHAWNAAGQTTLRQGLQLLCASRMLLCNDSGLMHVAAGIGKPVVAIFGATDPERTSPSGPKVRLLYRPADCSPCLKRECEVPGHPCMGNVLPEDVRDACLEMLA